jgi:hypothetical protein
VKNTRAACGRTKVSVVERFFPRFPIQERDACSCLTFGRVWRALEPELDEPVELPEE